MRSLQQKFVQPRGGRTRYGWRDQIGGTFGGGGNARHLHRIRRHLCQLLTRGYFQMQIGIQQLLILKCC